MSRPYAVSSLPHGAPVRSPSLFCIKLFFSPFSLMLHPDGFLFLSITYITKLECLHRAASHAISGCLSSSPIPLLSKASLPSLRVTLTHFALSSYEQALCLPTSFFHFRFGQTWNENKTLQIILKTFVSTHMLILSSTSPKEALACPPFSLHAFALIPLSLAKVQLSPTLTLSSLIIWYSGLTALFLFLLANAALAYLQTALSVALRPLFSFSASPVCSGFSAEACAILHALCWSQQHQQACHFTSPLI